MFKGLFDHAGSKLKVLIYISLVLGVIASIVYGIICINNDAFLRGIAAIVLGPVFTWLSLIFPYAVADTHENTEALIRYEMDRLQNEKNKTSDIQRNTEELLRYERERRYNERNK